MLARLGEILGLKSQPYDVAASKDNVGSSVLDDVSFQLGDFAIDEYKPMKIIAIGAGMSGILAGIRQV